MTNIYIYDDTDKRIEEITEALDIPVHELIDNLIDDYYETTFKEEVKRLLNKNK